MEPEVESFPSESVASTRGGIWLVYQDDQHTIHVWSSMRKAVERVYLNGELVSEKNGRERLEGHTFSDEEGHQLEAQFMLEDSGSGDLVYEIRRSDQVLQRYAIHIQASTKITLTRVFLWLGFGFMITLAAGVVKVPTMWLVIIFIAYFVAFVVLRPKNHLSIEELSEQPES